MIHTAEGFSIVSEAEEDVFLEFPCYLYDLMSAGNLIWVPLPFHLVYLAVFGVAFLYSGSLWSSLYCGGSSLWVGLDRWLVKVSWLGHLVLVFWWVDLDFFSLECSGVSSSEF